jgi:hypothetical protein
VFHYKVDQDLRPDDRGPYLALLHEPRTRIDDALAWLAARGYVLSRSAVARHRRRLLAAEQRQAKARDRALMFARMAGSVNAPDFTAGAVVQLQHLVLEHLIRLTEPTPTSQPGREDDASGGDANSAGRELTTAEYLALSKLVAQCVKVDVARERAALRRPTAPAAPPAPTSPAPLTPEERAARNADLRRRVEDILGGRR